MTKNEILIKLVSKRNEIVSIDIDDLRVEQYASVIEKYIKKHFDLLDVDIVIESLTHLGHAPNLYYDDNGNFAMTSDGLQSLPRDLDDTDDIEISAFVEKKCWKSTIREAIKQYLNY